MVHSNQSSGRNGGFEPHPATDDTDHINGISQTVSPDPRGGSQRFLSMAGASKIA